MDLEVGEDHRLEGTFHTGVGALDLSSAFLLTGFVEGDALSFCVDFGHLGSVASWSGHHISDEHGERIVTLWHLAQPVREANSEADVWGALLAGADEFVREE